VRAFTSIFEAHTERFRTGRADLALPSYADALAHLDADEDAAAAAWSTFEFAELQHELGNRQAAAEGLREAARVLRKSGDEDLELRANLHRLRADLAAEDDPAADAVLDGTARAVLWAFAFQIEPNGAPDDYTVAFYDELRERAAGRILAVRDAAADDSVAAEAAVRLASFLDPIASPFDLHVDAAAARAALDDRAKLKALLTPPAPEVGDAGLADARFATTARRIALRLAGDPSDSALLEAPS
jgi:hypothetical protein